MFVFGRVIINCFASDVSYVCSFAKINTSIDMKKGLLATINVALLSVLLVSCGKTTKGKLVGEYDVVSLNYSSVYTSPNYKEVTSESFANGIYAYSYQEYEDGELDYSNTKDGKVESHTFTIKKDGTWERKLNYHLDYSSDFKTVFTISESGTWSFMTKNKSDEFKKNERVIFNVTSSYYKESDVETGEVVWMDEDIDSYKSGYQVRVYRVIESKKGELELELDHSMTESYSSTNSPTAWNSNLSSKSTIKLKEK